jgi:DNA-binding winged helix-turn-helix (wHTH) protein
MTETLADPISNNASAVTVHNRRFAATGASRSDVLFRDVTSQLVAVFRAQGCPHPLADELAQKVTREVRERVREVLRRPGLNATWIFGVIQVGELTLDLEGHLFWRGQDEVHLSPKEFDLLALLMKNTGVLLTHSRLLRSVWGLEYGGELEYLRTTVHTLRRKIEKNPASPEYIVSEPCVGYRFRNPATLAPRFAHSESGLQRLVPMSGLGGAR